MIFFTISDSLAASITRVSFMAGSRISTAVLASEILRSVDITDQCTRSREVRRVKAKALAGHVQINACTTCSWGRRACRPLVSRRKCSASSGVRNALWCGRTPGEARIARILEIHNGVLIAVEQRRIEGLDALCAIPCNQISASGCTAPATKRLKKAAEAAPSKQ